MITRSRDEGPDSRERGATVILVVTAMVGMFLFGAFAVDLGSAWSQRRQNQGAVDTGTVAGALQTRGVSKAAAIAAADAEIMRITRSSIDPTMSQTAWNALWAGCADPDKGAEFTITAASDCISYTSTLAKIRVRTPLIGTTTTFATFMGIDTLYTDAAAEVTIAFGGLGAVLPFGMPGNAAANAEICLKTGADPQSVAPCDGPTTGNFSFLDITEYGNAAMGTTTSCTGATNTRLARNIARGIDHPIITAPNATASFRRDVDGCLDGNVNYAPYSLTTETGNKVGVLDNGFIEGVSGLPGRLTLSSNTITAGGKTFDDTPLWAYLNQAGRVFCANELGGFPVANHDDMLFCMSQMTGNTVYFEESLGDSARFGWVPLFYGTDLGTGNTTHNISEFRPVYIQTTMWSCNPNDCGAIHNPSEGIIGTLESTHKLEAVSAMQIPRGALPDAIDDGFFGEGSETVYAISE